MKHRELRRRQLNLRREDAPKVEAKPAPPTRLRPDRFNYWWFASQPDVAEVTWIVALACTGRKTHPPVALVDVARVVLVDGSVDFSVPDTERVAAHALPPIAEAPDASGVSRSSWAFACPVCNFNGRIAQGRLADGLKAIGPEPSVQFIDVSLLC